MTWIPDRTFQMCLNKCWLHWILQPNMLRIAAQYAVSLQHKSTSRFIFCFIQQKLQLSTSLCNCIGLFTKSLVFLILSLYAWTMLLLYSLVVQSFKSFFSVQAQRIVLSSVKEAWALPAHFLAHWVRVSCFEEAVFKGKSLNLCSFALQTPPHPPRI